MFFNATIAVTTHTHRVFFVRVGRLVNLCIPIGYDFDRVQNAMEA